MQPHNDSQADGGVAAPRAVDASEAPAGPTLTVVAGFGPTATETPELTAHQEQVVRMRLGLGVGQDFSLTHKAGKNRQVLRQLHALELLLRQEPRAAPTRRQRRPIR